ncbi:MAG: hypothetical protein LBJ76_06430, partial [Candidatus Accumulibacter sp.]|nr:hypothetical protein [Accumulibacter sp.]
MDENSYREILRSVARETREKAALSLRTSLDTNPDDAAKARKLGRAIELPQEIVLRNLPEVEREIDFERINEVLKGSPGTARWMANPENAKVARDDVETLSALELWHSTAGALLSGAYAASAGTLGAGEALARTVGSVEKARPTLGLLNPFAMGMAALGSDETRERLFESGGVFSALGEGLEELRQGQQQAAIDAAGDLKNAGFLRKAWVSALQSIGMNAPGMM